MIYISTSQSCTPMKKKHSTSFFQRSNYDIQYEKITRSSSSIKNKKDKL